MSAKNICVLGLGYIGLPTASMLATHGFRVLGVDVNARIVQTINRGDIHIEEPGLKTLVQAAIHSGNLTAAEKPDVSDVYIIAVPTPITHDKHADLSYIQAAARTITPLLKKSDLVILESTSPPGTTKNFLCPILEESGLKAGEDFYVAHCPERVLPGKIIKELTQNTRVMGGINHTSAKRAKELYQTFVEGEVHLTDATTAEMVKIMENTYRDVNIALANEVARICHRLEINAWDVVTLANLHPRVHVHQPGPGVGGHCISVDPWFIVEQFPEESRLIQESRRLNDAMPDFVYRMVSDAVADIRDPKVTVLGVTYKANVDDVRESPFYRVLERMKENTGLQFSVYDPHVKHFEYELSDLETALRDSDCILLAVDHAEFKYLHPKQVARLMRNRVVIDTRNALSRDEWVEAGFDYRLLGHGRMSTPELSRISGMTATSAQHTEKILSAV